MGFETAKFLTHCGCEPRIPKKEVPVCQMRTDVSVMEYEDKALPLSLNATADTEFLCPSNTCQRVAVFRS